MLEETISLASPNNFTLCPGGLVQEIDKRSWDKIWKPLAGRPKGIVFVFDAASKRLLYTLRPGEKISLGRRIIDPLEGTKYMAFAVSEQLRTFRFQASFAFGDTKVSDLFLEIRFRTEQYEDVAVLVAENGDVVKELCHTIKTCLDRSFAEIRMENIDSLQQFTERIHATVNQLNDETIQHPYLVLEGVSVQFTLPKSIEDAFNSIQLEEIQERTALASLKREQKEAEQKHVLERMKKQAALDIDEIELQRLGITDPRVRLLMRDPEKRAQYLDELYHHQMELLRSGQEQDKELLDIRLETIRKFRDRVLDEHSRIEDLKELLSFVAETTGAAPTNHFLTSVVDETEGKIKRLESTTYEGSRSVTTTESPVEDEHSDILSESKPKGQSRQRRRSKASDDSLLAEFGQEDTSAD